MDADDVGDGDDDVVVVAVEEVADAADDDDCGGGGVESETDAKEPDVLVLDVELLVFLCDAAAATVVAAAALSEDVVDVVGDDTSCGGSLRTTMPAVQPNRLLM